MAPDIGGRGIDLQRKMPVRHDDDAIGQLQDLVEVLAHQQHGGTAVAGLHDAGADLGDGREVEAEAGIGHDQQVAFR